METNVILQLPLYIHNIICMRIAKSSILTLLLNFTFYWSCEYLRVKGAVWLNSLLCWNIWQYKEKFRGNFYLDCHSLERISYKKTHSGQRRRIRKTCVCLRRGRLYEKIQRFVCLEQTNKVFVVVIKQVVSAMWWLWWVVGTHFQLI